MIKKHNKSGILEYYQDGQSKMKEKSPLEKIEQINLNSFCEKLWPNQYVMMWHTVGEGKRDAYYGSMLKKRGKKDGVPDWIVLIGNEKYNALLIELKRSRKKDSSVPKPEIKFMHNAIKFGSAAVVAYGYKAAIEAIKDYFNNELTM